MVKCVTSKNLILTSLFYKTESNRDNMTDFKAGQKAILDKKEVKFIVGADHLGLFHLQGHLNPVAVEHLDHCFTVRILDNGQARQVNPVGEEPKYDVSKGDGSAYRFLEWREAESKCRTLPMMAGLLEGVNAQAFIDNEEQWYAYIDTFNQVECFVLVKPLSK